MNYVWTVTNMYTVDTPDPGFVTTVEWLLTGTEGDYTASMKGISYFTNQEGTFIPYDQLTQQQVIGWVQDQLGADGVANCEANIQGQISTQINPPVVPQNQPLPWATPAA